MYLGLYPTEPEAARVYDRALVLLSGPAAATNFPASNYSSEMSLYSRHASGASKAAADVERCAGSCRQRPWLLSANRSELTGRQSCAAMQTGAHPCSCCGVAAQVSSALTRVCVYPAAVQVTALSCWQRCLLTSQPPVQAQRRQRGAVPRGERPQL